jgi:hypothetical protein
MKTKKAPWAIIALGLSLLVVGTVMAQQIAKIDHGDKPEVIVSGKTDAKPSSEIAKAAAQTAPKVSDATVAAKDAAKPSSGVAKIDLGEPDSIVILGFDGKYASNYVTPNGVGYGDPIYRIDLTASFRNGIVVGLTKIGSFGNGNSPYSEEYQAFIEKTWRPCSDEWYITTGFRYEFIRGPWDLGIPYGEIGRNWGLSEDSKLTAYGRAEYWWNPQGTTTDNGTIVTVGIKLLTKVSDRFSVSVGASAIYDPGVQGGVPALNGKIGGRVNYALTPDTTIYTGGDYYIPNTYGSSRLKTEGVFEVGVKIDDFPKQFGKAINFLKGEGGSD